MNQRLLFTAAAALALISRPISAAERVVADPARAVQGNQVTLRISGFAPNSLLTILLDGAKISSQSDYANGAGGMDRPIAIPKTLANGAHTVTVTDVYHHRADVTVTVGGNAAAPTLSIEPNAGLAGTACLIKGKNWENRKRSVTLQDAGGRTRNLRLSSDCYTSDSCQPGDLQLGLQIPADSADGQSRLTVSDGITQATVVFTVLPLAVPGPGTRPAIILEPSSGPVGTWVTVNGSGYSPNVQVIGKWDQTILTGGNLISIRTDAQGRFSGFRFQVPAGAAAGVHTVTVSDALARSAAANSNSGASAVFTVTANKGPGPAPAPRPTPDPTPRPTPNPTPLPQTCDPKIPSYSQPGCIQSDSGQKPTPAPKPRPAPEPPIPSPATKFCDPSIPHYQQPGCVEKKQ
jgi:hypothetical protein